ncbi:hypothetical protein Bca52824_055321 [Brassica carinata]|uniref:Uncharacterized protein n=1 Tax=Brassica carinata TaxID=52824 RepID=A0A8X7UNJ5_BRACI|nr:hypothetical protein Bca52824_055321 [Brassica carinata]
MSSTSPLFVLMVACGIIPTTKYLWNGNPLVILLSLVEARCWMQLLLGTMNFLGRWRILLKHFRRLCFR